MPHFGPILGPSVSRESQQLDPSTRKGALAAQLALHTLGMEKMFGWKAKNSARPLRMIDAIGANDRGNAAVAYGLLSGAKIATAMGKHGDPFAVVPAAAVHEKRARTRHTQRHVTLTDMMAQSPNPYDVLNATDAAFLAGCITVEDIRNTQAT